jgi:hypothetical protein
MIITDIAKKLIFRNWKTTITGLATGAALGYVGYTTAQPELIMAGATAAVGGIVSSDAVKKPSKKKVAKKKPVVN